MSEIKEISDKVSSLEMRVTAVEIKTERVPDTYETVITMNAKLSTLIEQQESRAARKIRYTDVILTIMAIGVSVYAVFGG